MAGIILCINHLFRIFPISNKITLFQFSHLRCLCISTPSKKTVMKKEYR